MRRNLLASAIVAILLLACATLCAQELRVNVMPGNTPGNIYPQTWPGRDMVVWGNVHDGTPPYAYTWDFGDGSPQVSGAVTSTKYIAVNHTYLTTGPKSATLTVTDAAGASDQDVVVIEVAPREAQVEINAAIEAGLRWQYLQQGIDGRWQDNAGYPNTNTALAVLALENQGHLASNDFDEDIYAEYVKQGLDWLTGNLVAIGVGVQAAGNPEEAAPGNTDANGIGIYANSNQPVYEIGMVMMAIVASQTPDAIAPNGPANVVGRTYRDIMVDMVDYCAWAQTEPSAGAYRGGWRYGPNYSSSDNSVSQWPVIGLEAAETDWGIETPPFVKTELQLWLAASQFNGGYWDGAFGYIPGNVQREAIPATGAGICLMSYCDISQYDLRLQRSLNFLQRMWGSSYNKGFYYSMYGIAKGCRIAVDNLGDPSQITRIGAIDWYDDYATYLVGIQNAVSGQWPQLDFGYLMDHSWALLILQKVIASPAPVAVISAPPSVPPETAFPMDGSGSYHLNPARSVVQWLWDFDEADGIDWNTPDAVGTVVTNPGYVLPEGAAADTFIVTLQVIDDGVPAKTSVKQHAVIVDYDNHPPTAVAGGPYAGMIGEMITFDGSGSYDSDAGDYVASFSWDLDGDGVFGDCTEATCQRSWNTLYSGYVSLMVTDSHGAHSWDTSSVKVWTSTVDVSVANEDIAFSIPYPLPGDDIEIGVIVRCDAASDQADGVQVRFYDGDPSIATHQVGATQTIPTMNAGDAVPVSVAYTVPDELPRTIFVRLDPDDLIEEFNESNNLAVKLLESSTPVGSVFGHVTSGGNGLHGVLVNLTNDCALVATTATDEFGGYAFPELPNDDYLVELHVPLGMIPVGESAVTVTVEGQPIEVNFELTEAAPGKVANVFWWKNHLRTLREGDPSTVPFTAADINDWCQVIFNHFYDRPDAHAIRIEGVTYVGDPAAPLTFDDVCYTMLDAHATSWEARVRFSLLGVLLNVASDRLRLTRVVTEDGATASQAITHFVNVYWDNAGWLPGEYDKRDNLRQAYASLCEIVAPKLLAAGLVPLSTPNIMFKSDGDDADVLLPSEFALYQNYPNPFNPVTSVRFALPKACNASLTIYNIMGQKVATLVDRHLEAGEHEFEWDSRSDGNVAASGVYFYKLETPTFSATKKMLLIK